MTIANRVYKLCEWFRRWAPSTLADSAWLLDRMDTLWCAMTLEEQKARYVESIARNGVDS